jgi:hypothetical protein
MLSNPLQTRPSEARDKALAINLDPRRYGTFAEIGAGQEVVRWFFRAGGAAGTIAKSISAYDMTVSDAIYGSCDRYVCRERLEKMLEYEYALNCERLRERRGNQTAFFAFADTVVARSFRGNHECHGWMGVTFQSHPRDQASRIVLHVRMLDSETTLQQEALGIVGVNLLYGAFFLFSEPDVLVESLLDGLGTARIEIDMIEFSGIEFRHVDNRVMSLRLVQLGLSGAAMFAEDGLREGLDIAFVGRLSNEEIAHGSEYSGRRGGLRRGADGQCPSHPGRLVSTASGASLPPGHEGERCAQSEQGQRRRFGHGRQIDSKLAAWERRRVDVEVGLALREAQGQRGFGTRNGSAVGRDERRVEAGREFGVERAGVRASRHADREAGKERHLRGHSGVDSGQDAAVNVGGGRVASQVGERHLHGERVRRRIDDHPGDAAAGGRVRAHFVQAREFSRVPDGCGLCATRAQQRGGSDRQESVSHSRSLPHKSDEA